MISALAPLSWALAGLVTIFLLTRESRPTEEATRIALQEPTDLRPAA